MELLAFLILIVLIGIAFGISGLVSLQAWRFRDLCKGSKLTMTIYFILAILTSVILLSVFLKVDW